MHEQDEKKDTDEKQTLKAHLGRVYNPIGNPKHFWKLRP